MRSRVALFVVAALICFSGNLFGQVQAQAQATATTEVAPPDIRAELLPSLEAFQKAFNEGKAEELAGFFLEDGEFVDEQGAVYSGREAIKELMTQFFKDFPGVQLGATVESLRQLGPDLLIEEGTRDVFAADSDAPVAKVRYVAVRAKRDGKWYLATVREFNDDPTPTPGERLAPLGFLIGNWVNEGQDATLKISFRWSEDGNFLIGEYESFKGGESEGKSTQRFGWDPIHQQIRSWLFEPDGAYSEGLWSATDSGWLCKSSSVLPDGTTGAAHVEVIVKSDDSFLLKGRDRVIGGSADDDYEVNVVRQVEKSQGGNSGAGK